MFSCHAQSAAAATAAPLQVFPDLSNEDSKLAPPSWLFMGDGLGIVSPHIPAAMQRPCWHVDQFVLESQLYRSARSQLFDATDRRSGMRVALKVYHKSQMVAINRLQVEREVNIQMNLDHPNIIKLYAAFSDDRNIFLVQEFADGGDLFSKVQVKGSRLSESKTQGMVLTFLAMLNHLHAQEVIHRDIKPENILLTSAGVIKITDFGLAINLKEERPVTRLGTLEYMAPEVIKNPDKTWPMENKDNDAMVYTKQVDIWAIGVLTFELLVGRAPFERDTYQGTCHSILHHDPILPLWLSRPAKTFIRAALCKNALKRPSIQQLLNHPWLSAAPDSNSSSDSCAAAAAPEAPPPPPPQLASGWPGQEAGRVGRRSGDPVKAAEPGDKGPSSRAVISPLPALLYRSCTLDLRSEGPNLLQILDEEDLVRRQAQRASTPPAAAAAAAAATTASGSGLGTALSQPLWTAGRQELLPQRPAAAPLPRRSRVLSDQGQAEPLRLSPPLSTHFGNYLAWQHGSDELGDHHLRPGAALRPSNNRIRALDFAPRPEPLAEPRPSPPPGSTPGAGPRTPEYGARRGMVPELSPVKHSSQGRPLMFRNMQFSTSCRALDCGGGAGSSSRCIAAQPEPSPGPSGGGPRPAGRPLIQKTVSSGSIGFSSKVLDFGRKCDFIPESHPAKSDGKPSTPISSQETLAVVPPMPGKPRTDLGVRLSTGHPGGLSPRPSPSAHDLQVQRSVSPMFGVQGKACHSQAWSMFR